MALDIFNLQAVLRLATEEFDKGLDAAKEKAKKGGSKIGAAFSTVTKVGAGMGAAVAAAGAAVYGLSKKAADTTDHIDKMSQKLGVSREAYQELDFIMSQSGTSVDSLRGGMKTLTSAMSKAASGNKDAAATFQRLGVSVRDSNGNLRSQEEVMFDTMAALQNVSNDTEKAALATQLFGKSGQELMPLLNGASGSIDEMREMAHSLGLVLDDEAIDAGVHLTDTIDQVQRSFDAIMAKVGVEVMPLVQKALDWVLANMPTIQTVVGTAFDILGNVVKTAGDIMMKVFEAVQPYIPAIKDAFQAAVGAIVNFWETKLSPMFSAVWTFICETLAPDLKKAWEETIGPAISTVFDMVYVMWTEKIGPALAKFWSYVTETLAPAIKTAWEETIGPAITTVMESISTFWTETLQPALSEFWTFITETLVPAIKTAWEENIGPAVTTAMEAISTFWTETLQPALSELWTFVTETLVPAMKTAWEETISPIVTAAMDAIKTAWTEVLQPVFVSIVKKVGALKDKFQKVWEEYIGPTVKTVMDGIQTVWTEVLQPVFVSIFTKVGALKDKFQEVWEEYIGPTISTVFDGIKTVWDEVLYPVFVKIAQILARLQTTFKTVWEDKISPLVDTVFEAIKGFYDDYLAPVFDGISTALDTISETWDTVFNGMKSVVDVVFGDGEDSISSKIGGAIDFIQGLFDGIDFTLPDVDLPHFVFDGWSKWGPISIPNLHVEWYRKAYDNPIMFNSPTVLPTLGGLKGFGDGAGGEIVMSERKLRELTGGGATTNNVTFNVYAAEGQDPEEIARAVQRQFAEWEDQRRAAYV